METYVYVLIGVLVAVAGGAQLLGEGYTAACEAAGGEYRQAEQGELGYPGWLCTEGGVVPPLEPPIPGSG